MHNALAKFQQKTVSWTQRNSDVLLSEQLNGAIFFR